VLIAKPIGVPIATFKFWMNHVQLSMDSVSITPYATEKRQVFPSTATTPATDPLTFLSDG